MIEAGYKISTNNGLVVTQADIDYFNNVADKNIEEFACLKSGFCEKSANKIVLSSDKTTVCVFTADQLKAQANTTATKVLMSDCNP